MNEEQVTVKETKVSNDTVLISSDIDMDCVAVRKEYIPELVSKLREHKDW